MAVNGNVDVSPRTRTSNIRSVAGSSAPRSPADASFANARRALRGVNEFRLVPAVPRFCALPPEARRSRSLGMLAQEEPLGPPGNKGPHGLVGNWAAQVSSDFLSGFWLAAQLMPGEQRERLQGFRSARARKFWEAKLQNKNKNQPEL